MNRHTLTFPIAPWAGLAAGPACWAVSTQLNYALVQPFCDRSVNVVPLIAGALVIVSLAGALWSLLAGARYGGSASSVLDKDGNPRKFLAGVGLAAGVLFALVIAMQGFAALVLDPCLR
jgi:hypothetical protein